MPFTGSPRTWVAGEVPTAAMFNENVRDFARAFTDAWTAYTPTVTSASNPQPSGWTQTGYYMRVGKLVVARFAVIASSTLGTGTYRIALPVTAASTYATGSPIGQAFVNGSQSLMGMAWISGGSTYLSVCYYGAGSTRAGDIGASSPFAWASSNSMVGQITYEAA